MSVYYYSCECCGEARYEEAVTRCEGCGERICYNCIVGTEGLPEGYFFPEGSENENGELKKEYCPICNQKAIDNENPHKDFLGNALNVGDEVVANKQGYRSFRKYTIARKTEQMLFLYVDERRTYKIEPSNVIKI